jgi:hypothetical protein
MLRLSDGQLKQLRATAATIPVEARDAFLKLFAAHLELEGDLASASAFNRALAFARDSLYRDVA